MDADRARALLFQPLPLGKGGHVLPNRIWLPAMVTWRGTDDGFVTPSVREVYLRYAMGGAGMIVLEAIPAALAREITAAVASPTIGIGAGVDCHGQVLVLHDMLDVYPGRKAKFVKNYMRGTGSIQGAVELYVKEVKARTFPGPEHSF